MRTGPTIYQDQTNFNGVTNTSRSRLKAVDRLDVMRNPMPPSEFKKFLEKSIELGIDLGAIGHT